MSAFLIVSIRIPRTLDFPSIKITEIQLGSFLHKNPKSAPGLPLSRSKIFMALTPIDVNSWCKSFIEDMLLEFSQYYCIKKISHEYNNNIIINIISSSSFLDFKYFSFFRYSLSVVSLYNLLGGTEVLVTSIQLRTFPLRSGRPTFVYMLSGSLLLQFDWRDCYWQQSTKFTYL